MSFNGHCLDMVANKLTCNEDNTVLLYQINNIMIYEKVIMHIIALLLEIVKRIIPHDSFHRDDGS